jgi:hypothetical protein
MILARFEQTVRKLRRGCFLNFPRNTHKARRFNGLNKTDRRGVMQTTLVAVYPTRTEAEDVQREIIKTGLPEIDVAVSANGVTESAVQSQEKAGGFWGWLFGADIPERDRSWYEATLDETKTAVSVRISDEGARAEVEAIMTQHAPLSMEEDEGAALSSIENDVARSETAESGEVETTIPIVKETLEVGKRITEQRYRIRVYPVERSVEERVNLRDETVIVERRPATDPTSTSPEDLKTRELEVIERHEAPVVAKTARATEEVVVRKDVRDRTEVVSDTVRETKVHVDRSDANIKRSRD